MRARAHKHRGRDIAIVVITLLWVLPVVWIIATAFKPRADVFSLAILFEPTLANVIASFQSPYLVGSRLLNSVPPTPFRVSGFRGDRRHRWCCWPRSSCRR
jgi:multiple sugar transport system permease protein